jgi:hypothetical protein
VLYSATVPPGPANPGYIPDQEQVTLAMLPPKSSILEVFTKLTNDNNISNEEALLKLLATYNISIEALNSVSYNV